MSRAYRASCVRIGACRNYTRIALLVVALSIPASAARAEDSLPKGTLSGKIVDAEGGPVAGARVRINTWDDKLLVQAVSDAHGRFELGPTEPVYRHFADIVIEAEGFARQYVLGGTYSVFPGANHDLGEIRMDAGCSFRGRVLDHDGTPLGDAVVECTVDRFYLGNTVMPVGPPQTVKTDAQGYFRTPPLRVGDRGVYVRFAHRQVAHVEPPAAPQGEKTLPTIVLKRDVPIHGTVVDSRGTPIAGAEVQANADGDRTTSDAAGKFVLSGFGSRPRFQLQVKKEGYEFINWGVSGGDDGLRWHEVGGNGKELGPVEQLNVVMEKAAWIEGEAVDDETGEPVHLDRVVLCFFERKANGEVVLNGCRSLNFEQPQTGRFRLPYTVPDEFHLTLSARGYHDGEAFTPKVTALTPIEGISVKMRRKTPGSLPAVQSQAISGEVTDQGRPVETGWVGLWLLRPPKDAVNCYIMRGRTVAADEFVCASAPIHEGRYTLSVPYQGDAFYLVAESPGRAPTQLGPLAIGLGEEKSLDIACVDGGEIRGAVKNRPTEWKNDLWVVAFTDTGLRAESRILSDGTFALRKLPPGRYGLKTGHDGFRDAEVPHRPNIPPEAWTTDADPWRRAMVVELTAGQRREGIELELPEN